MVSLENCVGRIARSRENVESNAFYFACIPEIPNLGVHRAGRSEPSVVRRAAGRHRGSPEHLDDLRVALSEERVDVDLSLGTDRAERGSDQTAYQHGSGKTSINHDFFIMHGLSSRASDSDGCPGRGLRDPVSHVPAQANAKQDADLRLHPAFSLEMD